MNKEMDGPTPPPETFSMPIMNRGLEEVVYPQQDKYPSYGDTEAMGDYHAKVCLRRMPTKHCGILELHGVQTLLEIPGGIEKAVDAARAAGYSDNPGNRFEAVDPRSSWGPSGLLIASLSQPNEVWEKKMEEVGFTRGVDFFNPIWDKEGSGRINKCSFWWMILNEKARTGEGNWREEPFYKARRERLLVKKEIA